MIKITIERMNTEQYKTRENLVKKRTPTQVTEQSDYGNRKEVKHIEEFEIAEVTKYRETRQTLLSQEILDESTFNLTAVIAAVNNMAGKP